MVEAVIRRPAAADLTVVTAAACLVGSELIHTVVLPEHLREWWAAGVFFAVVSLLEGGLAAAVLFAPSRRVWLAALTLSVATVAVWAWSRTAGLPFGPDPWTPEAVGRAHVAAGRLAVESHRHDRGARDRRAGHRVRHPGRRRPCAPSRPRASCADQRPSLRTGAPARLRAPPRRAAPG